jgi:hypothetical protein
MFHAVDPSDSLFLVRPDKRREITLGYNMPVETDYWDPDGTPEFAQMLARLGTSGMVWERAR